MMSNGNEAIPYNHKEYAKSSLKQVVNPINSDIYKHNPSEYCKYSH